MHRMTVQWIGYCLERLTKTEKNFSQDNRSSDPDYKQVHLVYKSERLPDVTGEGQYTSTSLHRVHCREPQISVKLVYAVEKPKDYCAKCKRRITSCRSSGRFHLNTQTFICSEIAQMASTSATAHGVKRPISNTRVTQSLYINTQHDVQCPSTRCGTSESLSR